MNRLRNKPARTRAPLQSGLPIARPLRIGIFVLLTGCMNASAWARIAVAEHIQDQMVVQRGMSWEVSGTADVGERFIVRFLGQQREVRPSEGAWSVRFDVPSNNAGPAELTIDADRLVRRILVGDVWFCSGQSNMAMTVARASDGNEIIQSAQGKALHIFQVPRPVRQPDAGRWMMVTSTEQVRRFSAVCLAFGIALHDRIRIPIGLIDASLGGTWIESWMSSDSFRQLSSAESARARYARIQRQQESSAPRKKRTIGKDEPSHLYELMVRPHASQAIRGVLWYQGESNLENAGQYAEMLTVLMKDWRANWHDLSLPFVVMQLPGFGTPSERLELHSRWAAIRDAQRIAVASSQPAALVVSMDLGDGTLHPGLKRPFGQRAANAALELTKGAEQQDLSPMPTRIRVLDNAIRVELGNGRACLERTQHLPQLVYIAGDDRRWHAAEATLDGISLVLRSPGVTRPVAVRYAWSDHPRIGLRSCGSRIPVTPFRTDGWPLELSSSGSPG